MSNKHTGCDWCKPSVDGDYTMSLFQNPDKPEQEATLSVYGGEIAMTIAMAPDAPKARMAVSINFCPMCGRAFDGRQEH